LSEFPHGRQKTRYFILCMRTLGIACTAVLATALSLALAGSALATPVKARLGQSPAQVRKYWTPERMQRAVPVAERRLSLAGLLRPRGKPGGGSSWSATEVAITPGTPLTAHGKVFFSAGSANYVCSGTALDGNVVWTAGHCVNEGPGGYYTNFVFVPAYRDGVAPYGTFPATSLLTSDSWALSGEFGVDVGAAVPATNAAGQTLSEAVVERPIVFNATRDQAYDVYGYPAAKRFSGNRLYVCKTAWSRDDTSTTPDTIGVPCNMTGGSSGGGWVTSAGAVASVTSYGYSSLKNVLFGPHLESEAQQVYDAAVAAATP
jgi:V8-like Glu-specific endopeptidase